VLEDARHSDWGRIDRFDHRTLEYAHDLLAASWRFRSNDRQARLPFVALDHPTRAESRWVSWLRREVEGWIDKPYFVRWVQLILANQNQPRGDVAEAELCLAIMSSYSDVPWDEKRICALEAKLDRART
jgi:hypothetical protein